VSRNICFAKLDSFKMFRELFFFFFVLNITLYFARKSSSLEDVCFPSICGFYDIVDVIVPFKSWFSLPSSKKEFLLSGKRVIGRPPCQSQAGKLSWNNLIIFF
jgi:hypothetical protein